MRYAWTLSADWRRLARVQTLISNLIDLDPFVYDWPHIHAPTLAFLTSANIRARSDNSQGSFKSQQVTEAASRDAQ